MESASELNETALGYRIYAQRDSFTENFGIKINPQKSNKVQFTDEDFIIVLAED